MFASSSQHIVEKLVSLKEVEKTMGPIGFSTEIFLALPENWFQSKSEKEEETFWMCIIEEHNEMMAITANA